MPEYDWRWIKAQGYQESLLNPVAVSHAGAVGLMQIMPRTGLEISRQSGISGPLTNPTISVLFGTFYMRRMLNTWTSPRTDLQRLELAFASYNSGSGNIIKAQKLSGGHLLWCGVAPHLHQVTGRHSIETITYVQRIKRWYRDLTNEE